MFFAGMKTKFNQGSKKNELLSSIRNRIVRVVEKGVSITPPAFVTEPSRTASSSTLVKEITPLQKKPHVDDKGKDKADSCSSTVFNNAGLALARAHESFTAKELKVFSGVPIHEIVGRHIHKLVQVLYFCNFTLFPFFILLHCPECWISFSGVGGVFSHYFGVPCS